MPQGMIPFRGDWEHIRSPVTTLAQGQFQRGDLVAIGRGRIASLFTSSNMSVILGVATHDSLNSLPVGFATIALPRDGCTAYIDTLPTEARSSLSFGEAGSIVSFGGRTSTFSKLATSEWSRVVAIRTADQPLNSLDSRIEVYFIQNNLTVYSTSSVTFL